MSDQAGGLGDPWQGPTAEAAPAADPIAPLPPAPPGPRARPAQPAPSAQVHRTRISAVWVAVIVAAALLVALVIFIAQNARTVSIHYVGLDGRMPLAVALLAAAVAGMLLVAVAGTARIIQLRRAVKSQGTRPRTAGQQNPR
jgi:uncharacterized integral membrane protein